MDFPRLIAEDPEHSIARSRAPAVIAAARVVVVIPACEEEASIAAIVAGCRPHAASVIVVDDGSRDATAARAKEAGARVIVHRARRGKGAALMSGFARASAEGATLVATLDGDGQHRPCDLPRLLDVARRAPHRIVIGSRRAR